MPIQKTYNKTDGTNGDYWRIENFQIRIGTSEILLNVSLYKSLADFQAGKIPMTRVIAVLPLNTLSAAQLNSVKNSVEAALVAGVQAEFSGGTIV